MSKQQKMVKDEFAKLVKDLVIPEAGEADEARILPSQTVQKAWELGASLTCVPEEFGGFGGEDSPVENAIIMEELAYGDMAFAIAVSAPALFISPLMKMGTPAQQKKYLPDVCQGEYKPATLALNEPHFRFDPVDLKTTATRKNGSYILDGQKCFVPLAAKADKMLVAANLDGKNNLFIVSGDNPGLKVGDREKNIGLYALETNEISFENCEIPADNRLGGDNGCDYDAFLQRTRVAMAAMGTGVARASYEFARDYARERVQFNEPIANRQAVAFMIAEMAYEVDAMRLLTWKAASGLENGRDVRADAYLAKLYAGEMAMKITDYGVQVLGGHGYVCEYPVERYYRNGRGIGNFEGLATV